MSLSGLSKLSEEVGELIEAALLLIEVPPSEQADGQQATWQGVEDEIADVYAAMAFAALNHHVAIHEQSGVLDAPFDPTRLDQNVHSVIQALSHVLIVCGKRAACPDRDDHWDGKGSLSDRMTEAFSLANRRLTQFVEAYDLSANDMASRTSLKLARFHVWHHTGD